MALRANAGTAHRVPPFQRRRAWNLRSLAPSLPRDPASREAAMAAFDGGNRPCGTVWLGVIFWIPSSE
jgi:hypothetical protein